VGEAGVVAQLLEHGDDRASRVQKGVGALPDPEALSLAERVQQVVQAPVTAGLHSIAAANLDEAPPEEDALICGDDPDAKELTLQLVGKLVAGRALDAGPLASARALEGLTAVIVNLNRRYKAHAGVRITGLE
jgi:predicted dinucleotide-binding enzyme